MKAKIRSSLFTLALVMPSLVAGCDDTTEGISRDAKDAERTIERSTAAAKTELKQEIEEFQRDSRKALSAMDSKLETLEQRSNAATREAKRAAQEELKQLKGKRRALQEQVDRLEAKTDKEWAETKRGLDQALAELGKDINQALDEAGDATEAALR